MKIKIISDTTCDLPEQLLKEYQITLLPLHITKGEESLLDGVQITPSDIFSYVDAGGEICTTASINPQEYVDAFAAYRAAYDAVIVITIGWQHIWHRHSRWSRSKFAKNSTRLHRMWMPASSSTAWTT